jgi:hypothetical protein
MASSPIEEVAFRGDDIIRDYIQKYSNWGGGARTTSSGR